MTAYKYYGTTDSLLILYIGTLYYTSGRMATQEQWIRHFRDMADGKIKPNANGRWIVKDYNLSSSEEPKAPVTLVSNVQQPVNQAKATQKRKRKETQEATKKKTYTKPWATHNMSNVKRIFT